MLVFFKVGVGVHCPAGMGALWFWRARVP